MKVLGVNSGHSLPASYPGAEQLHHLNDGSAALLDDGEIVFAAIEERHTRTRYAGGFLRCLSRWKEFAGLNPWDADAIAFSSCCGPKWTSETDVLETMMPKECSASNGPAGSAPRVVIVDHHESHASLGFMLSGFDRALVATIDGFGNLITSDGWGPKEWWNGHFERNSYYVAERKGKHFTLNKIATDATGKEEIGIGELYSYLTHFCGWHSYQHCGTVMALSAFGDPSVLDGLRFLDYGKDHLKVLLPNDHPHSSATFRKFLISNGVDLHEMTGRTAEPGDKKYCDLIALLQQGVMNAIVARLTGLAERLGLSNIVLTGGVALNCLAAGTLARSFGGRVFVPPAPSDTGQALGNAIWAGYCTSSPIHHNSQKDLKHTNAPFWGMPHSRHQIQSALEYLGQQPGIAIKDTASTVEGAEYASCVLADGALVATCIGRAEYGPRALGGRSVLGDPRKSEMPARVNSFKKREPFRPYAPSILEEHAEEYFTFPVRSPFMSFAVPLTEIAKRRVPAVVHADGTARVQTLGPDSSSPLRPILECFHKATGVPVLINTSFNRKGEPIVETPLDAAKTFLDSNIDVLLLENYIISRRKDLK